VVVAGATREAPSSRGWAGHQVASSRVDHGEGYAGMTHTEGPDAGGFRRGRFPTGGLPQGPVMDSCGVGRGVPVATRIRDYWLGGKNAFEPDRETGDLMGLTCPSFIPGIQACQRFVHRAVWHLSRCGVEQFMDLTPGFPISPALHETAGRFSAGSRVVYVDHDRVSLAYRRMMYGTDERVLVLPADPFHPGTLLTSPTVSGFLDLDAPVAMILDGLFCQIPHTERAERFIRSACQALAPGSYLVLTHVSTQEQSPQNAAATRRAVGVHASRVGPMVLRNREDLTRLTNDLRVLPPGITTPDRWRVRTGTPPRHPAQSRQLPFLACVARTPGPDPYA
jgi:hypothetical protein